VLAAVGCTVVLLLIVLVAIILASRAGGNDHPATGYSASTASSATPNWTDPKVAPEFAGTWKGTGYQVRPRVTHWTVEITLADGGHYGTVKYPRCSGSLKVLTSSVDELFMRQTITTGTRNCAVQGYVALTAPGSTAVQFSYTAGAADDATGTLYKV
jgi:hypothetical protein